jgi:hypothetical protein
LNAGGYPLKALVQFRRIVFKRVIAVVLNSGTVNIRQDAPLNHRVTQEGPELNAGGQSKAPAG